MKNILLSAAALLVLSACQVSEEDIKAAGEGVGKIVGETIAEVPADSPAAIGAAFLKKNGKLDGVQTADSGLQYKVVQSGLDNGAQAAPGQAIAAHYHGYFIDGEVFDSSYTRGQPLTGPSNGFIKGWNEALGEMKVCEARTLYINSELAYGDNGRGGIPGGATLLFNMQLLAVNGESETEVFECPEDKILSGPDDYK